MILLLVCTLFGAGDDYSTIVLGRRERAPQGSASLPTATTEKLPGGLQDPLRQLGTLPGVAMLPFMNGQLIVRGTRAGDTQVLIDGMPVPYVFHFGSGFGPAVVPQHLIESLVFTPSNAGARYGGMLGGVIELQTIERREPVFHGRAAVDLLSAGASVHVAPKRSKLAFDVAARRSYIDGLAALVVPSVPDRLPAVIPYFTDGQLRAAIEDTPVGTFDLWLIGSDDGFAFVGGNASAASFADIERLVPATQFLAVKPRWRLRDRRGNEHQASALLSLGRAHTSVLDDTRWGLAFRADTLVQLWTGARLRLGLDVASTRQELGGKELPVALPPHLVSQGTTTFRQDVSRLAPFAELKGSTGRWSYELGVRLSHFVLAQSAHGLLRFGHAGFPDWAVRAGDLVIPPRVFSELEPRLAASVRLVTGLRLRAASGLYHALPPLAALPFLPKPELERAWQSSLGLQWKPFEFLSVEATGYLNLLWNTVNPPVIGLASVADLSRTGQRRAVGGELFVRVERFHGLSGWLSYTLSFAEDRLRNDSGALIGRPAEYAQTHVLALAAAYALPRNFSVGARFRLGSGWPVTPIQTAYYSVANDVYVRSLGPANSARTPVVHQLDLRGDKTFAFRHWRLSLYVEVLNVYAQKNPDLPYYAWDYSQIRYISVLPIVPMFGIEAQL